MSFLVCHAEKFSGSLKGIENHIERKTEINKNPDVNFSLSEINFDALTGSPEKEKNINYEKRFQKIMNESFHGKRSPRKDAVKMISIVVSSDKDFFKDLSEEKTKKFFKVSAEFLQKRFPHVISATVHMDEKTPHMHFTAVPLTTDGRLSAKEVLNREALQYLQSKLPEELSSAGFDISRGIEGSEKKHQTTDEWKREQALTTRKSKQLKKELEESIKPEKRFFRKTGNMLLSREKLEELTTIIAKMGNLEELQAELLTKEKSLHLKEQELQKTISNEVAKELREKVDAIKKESDQILQVKYNQLKKELEFELFKQARKEIEIFKNENNLNDLINKNNCLQREIFNLESEKKELTSKLNYLSYDYSSLEEKYKTEVKSSNDLFTKLIEKEREIQKLTTEKELNRNFSQGQENSENKKQASAKIKLAINRPQGRGMERER